MVHARSFLGARDSWSKVTAEPEAAGLSTKIAGRCAMESKRVTLTKAELLGRVQLWVSRRDYGVEVGPGWLEDLLKDGLIPAGRRGPNRGRSPTYAFDHRSYRLAIQIARLRKYGVLKRDEIIVVLFRNGYETPFQDVRPQLAGVWDRLVRSMRASLRSPYLGNNKEVPSSRQSAIDKALGVDDGGHLLLQLLSRASSPTEIYRAATQRGFASVDLSSAWSRWVKSSEELNLNDIAQVAIASFDGLLLTDADWQDNPEAPDHVDALIYQSSIDDLRDAADLSRLYFHQMTTVFRAIGISINSVDLEEVDGSNAARYSGVKAAASIVSALRLKNTMPVGYTAEVFRQALTMMKTEV